MKVNVPLPKYFLTKTVLVSRLRREFQPGAKLPSEHELAREFGVSRVTIQQALSLLEREAIVKREQGRGTFYLGEGTRRTELKLSTLLEAAINYRSGEFARMLEARTVTAVGRIAEGLGVAPNAPVVVVEGLEFVDGEPVTFIVSYFPEELGPKALVDSAGMSRKTIVSMLSERHGIAIASATQSIGATLADPTVARHLGIDVGSAVLEVERLFRNAEGRVVNFSIAFYRADRYRFQLPITGLGQPS